MSNMRKKNWRKKNTLAIYQDSESMLSAHISAEKQKARILRQSSWWKNKIADGICYYCGQKLQPSELTMDHKIPLSKGGYSEKINIVPCCKECNNKKKYLLPTEWDEYMEHLQKPQGD